MSRALVGVIPAAGRGTRAYPYTRLIPKAMLDVGGNPVLHYTLTLMRDELGIRDVVIVVGLHGNCIREHFGDGSSYSLRIQYVQNDRLDLGLAYSVLLAREHIRGSHFVVMLSDELYSGSNHGELLECGYQDCAATLVAREHSTNKEIRKNFGLEVEGPLVKKVVEKPSISSSGMLGCGTYIFGREIFEVLERRIRLRARDHRELTAAIEELIASGAPVRWFRLISEYININYQEDVHYARSILRRNRLARATIALVMPCESPPAMIEDVLRLARRDPRITEVILVAREEETALRDLAGTWGARLVLAPGLTRKSFGSLLRAGIEESRTDIVVLTRDDDSFDLADIDKLMAYICEADIVMGTRTTSQLVQQGTNLNWIARVGNYALAKLIELLWFNRGVRLTDVGCTFRAFWRYTYEQIAADLRSEGPEFSPEMVVEALRRRLWVIEVPINYCRTTEESRIRIEHRNFRVFFSMAAMVARRRFLPSSD